MQYAESLRERRTGEMVGVISIKTAVSEPDSACRTASVNEPTGDGAFRGSVAEAMGLGNCQAEAEIITSGFPKLHESFLVSVCPRRLGNRQTC